MNDKIIIKKLFLLTLLPLVVIAIILAININTTYVKFNELEYVRATIQKINNSLLLIKELQKERGIVSAYLGSNAKGFKEKLLLQRKLTDEKKQHFLKHCSYEDSKHLNFDLSNVREKIDNLSINSSKALYSYTHIIQILTKELIKIVKNLENEKIKNQFYLNINLLDMSESLGKIRGGVNGIITSKKGDEELVYFIVHAKGEYNYISERFKNTAQKKYLKRLEEIVAMKEYTLLEKGIEKYAKDKQMLVYDDIVRWFSDVSVVIDSLHLLKKEFLLDTEKFVKDYAYTLKKEFYMYLLIVFFLSLTILSLGYKIKNDILKNLKLLHEYKDAVDRSSIVSKTDIKGKITYANKKFCDMSGYSQEELLGEAHNIVRDPDIPSSVFKGMWSNLQKGKSWEGVLRNKKKNDEYYTVEVTISPILNHKGEIEEFIAIRNDITELIELQQEIQNTQKDLVYKLGEIGETRSRETGFHVKRVAKYSELLAYYYGLSKKEIENLTNASPMHDIGKIAIPDHILNKPGKLTEEEWSIMKTHSEIGYGLFKDSNKELLQIAAIISYEHHEKYDGTGYPRRLKGENINVMARITALADVFDALGSDRCYKKAWDDEKTFAFIKEQSGKHFDPKLVELFFEHLEEFLAIREKYSDKSSFMQET